MPTRKKTAPLFEQDRPDHQHRRINKSPGTELTYADKVSSNDFAVITITYHSDSENTFNEDLTPSASNDDDNTHLNDNLFGKDNLDAAMIKQVNKQYKLYGEQAINLSVIRAGYTDGELHNRLFRNTKAKLEAHAENRQRDINGRLPLLLTEEMEGLCLQDSSDINLIDAAYISCSAATTLNKYGKHQRRMSDALAKWLDNIFSDKSFPDRLKAIEVKSIQQTYGFFITLDKLKHSLKYCSDSGLLNLQNAYTARIIRLLTVQNLAVSLQGLVQLHNHNKAVNDTLLKNLQQELYYRAQDKLEWVQSDEATKILRVLSTLYQHKKVVDSDLLNLLIVKISKDKFSNYTPTEWCDTYIAVVRLLARGYDIDKHLPLRMQSDLTDTQLRGFHS